MAQPTDINWKISVENQKFVSDLERAQKEVAELNTALGKTETEAKQAGTAGSTAMNKTADSTQKATKEVTTFNAKLKEIAIGAAAFAGINFGIDSVKQLGSSVIAITSQFQKFKAVLTNTLGSEGAALNSLQLIQDFAAKTPFSVAELTDSFVKLVNSGFKPTEKELTSLGDLAASKGKQLDQLTEAIIDSQTGEFERLKEFGVKASKEGDKVTFTFKGIKTQVDFTQKSIEKYILGLGNLKGVSGSMSAISQTLGGRISNLGDTFDSLLLKLGDAFLPVINVVIDILSDLAGWVKENTGGIKAFSQGLADGLKFVAGYGKEILLVIQGFAVYKISVAVITAAMALFTTGVGTATIAIRAFFATILASPIGLVATGIAAATVALYDLIQAQRALSAELEKSNETSKQTLKNLDEQIAKNRELIEIGRATKRGDTAKIEELTTTDFEKAAKTRQEALKKSGFELSKISEKEFKDAKDLNQTNFDATIKQIKEQEILIFNAKRALKEGTDTALDKLGGGGVSIFALFGKPKLEAEIAEAEANIKPLRDKLNILVGLFAATTFTPEEDATKAAAKAHKDNAKAINEEVKALELLSPKIVEDTKKKNEEIAELNRADVQNLLDLQIEKDQIERNYELGKFDRQRAAFDKGQEIEKAQFDIEKNTLIREANLRVQNDEEAIKKRINARDSEFRAAIGKAKLNLEKLSGVERTEQQRLIDNLEKERKNALEEGFAEQERIRLEGAKLITATQEKINAEQIALDEKQHDADLALTEAQAKEKGELILKLRNELFDREDALATAQFNKQSLFRINDIKSFGEIEANLLREHNANLRKIDKEFLEKEADLDPVTDKDKIALIRSQKAAAVETENILFSDKRKTALRTRILEFVDGLKTLATGVLDIFNTLAEESNRRLGKIIDERQNKIDKINDAADAGQRISTEQLAIEERRREEAIEHQRQIANQQIQIAQAVALANAIAAIAKAAADPSGLGIGNIVLIAATIASLVAGYAAASQATQSEIPPLLATGGLIEQGRLRRPKHGILEGNSHANGGMLIEAEGGEAFLSKSIVKKYPKLVEDLIFDKVYNPTYALNPNQLQSININYQPDNTEMLDRLESIEKAIQNQAKTSVLLTERGLEVSVSKRQQNSQIAQTRGKVQ
jgi:hypothetical protein